MQLENLVKGLSQTYSGQCLLSENVKKSVQCIKCFGLTYRISTTVLLLRLHLKLLDAGVRSTRSPLYCVSVEIFVATRSIRIMCKFSVFVAGKNWQDLRKLHVCACLQAIRWRCLFLYEGDLLKRWSFPFSFEMVGYIVKVRSNLAITTSCTFQECDNLSAIFQTNPT